MKYENESRNTNINEIPTMQKNLSSEKSIKTKFRMDGLA